MFAAAELQMGYYQALSIVKKRLSLEKEKCKENSYISKHAFFKMRITVLKE